LNLKIAASWKQLALEHLILLILYPLKFKALSRYSDKMYFKTRRVPTKIFSSPKLLLLLLLFLVSLMSEDVGPRSTTPFLFVSNVTNGLLFLNTSRRQAAKICFLFAGAVVCNATAVLHHPPLPLAYQGIKYHDALQCDPRGPRRGVGRRPWACGRHRPTHQAPLRCRAPAPLCAHRQATVRAVASQGP